MSAPFGEEREELRKYVRGWLDERSPLEVVRRVMETPEGFDGDLWAEMGELGWLGIAIPEQFGGAGAGFEEVAVLAEEMGRTLFPSPFLATTVMAASLIADLGTDEQKSELLNGVAEGRRRLTVAEGEIVISGNTVSGTAPFVLDGHTADTILAVAGPLVALVEADSDGVTATRLDVMDLTRPLAKVVFDHASAVILGEDAGAVPAMGVRAVAALTMEQVGGAQTCLEMSVEYAKTRHQFGRPIGTFQAIKHMCADMLVTVESARSAAYHLSAVIDHDPAEVEVAAPLAKSYCSETYYQAAADTIQIHGGIGFTWEHDAHLYLKRAKSSQLLFGDPSVHRRALAGHLRLS